MSAEEAINTCTYCAINPKSHSFYCYQSNQNGCYLYKTVVAESILFDKPGTIIHHVEHDPHLSADLQWNWIIDMTKASRKHYMAVDTVRELSKWIKREKDNKCKQLKQIQIVGNYSILIEPLIFVAKLILPSHIKIIRGKNK